ncbi:ATP-binding protein [Ancylomarina euxinus]|uniref:ATP-binding protein n=1 Tax=Ancylomarina euxinus TaxID=2283627 RepID=A0A425Y1I0_9BACT|nr:ATP-binding protein [Ancylomarina euxinus]MCZ4693783.1 ATP-binding protein [Ancylomarina euxinus]MUP15137.1 ATP-binding protein [Ancylomarina euxinus]RRG21560.1 ATP-binding protein [Ancylomarina euxinus]
MARYERVKGGEKNKKTGTPFTKPELEEICQLYIEIDGKGIHENNPKIHALAAKIERTIRSVENQLLGFRSFVTGKTGRTNYNTLIPEVWRNRELFQEKEQEESQPKMTRTKFPASQNRELFQKEEQEESQPKMTRTKFPASQNRELFQKEEQEESQPKMIRTKFPASQDGNLKFRVSSGLKSIIGKDLITNDFIAVYELVKNSYDAYATQVDIIFENVLKGDTKIIIKDNGKGMNYNDLLNKWLFVAYSAKLDGTEDANITRSTKKKFFAGAKGVGRFSCDRLGGSLKLITQTNTDNSFTEVLHTDWDRFEEDSQKEFADIGVVHERLNSNPYDLTHGTVLEITNVRSNWDREKFLKLKEALAKLINPIQSETDIPDFVINLDVKEAVKLDKIETEYYKTINGPIKNFLFEKLGLKTTQIITEISDDGKTITTTLIDRDIVIYKLVEELSKKYSYLHNIKFHLFYLNQGAKVNFKKIMGVRVKEYGSVYLYKNGFRVNPYGDHGDDSLGIDVRKGQGYGRYLGLRELIGRIEINGENDDFKETSSRDGGIIKNRAYSQLKLCFEDYCLKRLEKYVVDAIKWGTFDYDDVEDLNDDETKERILSLISKLADTDTVISGEFNEDILSIVGEKQENSALNLLNKLKDKAKLTKDVETIKEVVKVEKRLDELKTIRAELEEENKIKEIEIKRNLSENLVLKSHVGVSEKELLSYHHHIGISTSVIEGYLSLMNEMVKSKGLVPVAEFNDFIKDASYELSKITTITNFATKKNYNLESEFIEDDLLFFIQSYINDVSKKVSKTFDEDPMNFEILDKVKEPFYHEFAILGVTIILDNLFKNASKAGSTLISITMKLEGNALKVFVIDNGEGVKLSVLERIFEFGVTTTDGSGMGLYHVKELMQQMNGTVEINPTNKKGAEFILTFNK